MPDQPELSQGLYLTETHFDLPFLLQTATMASETDIKVASLAAGFTLGFGFLTVWEAMKQTRRNRNPLRSMYIYMVWGEIAANLAIAIIGWLFLDGIIGPRSVLMSLWRSGYC
jgi:hypothetical protein